MWSKLTVFQCMTNCQVWEGLVQQAHSHLNPWKVKET